MKKLLFILCIGLPGLLIQSCKKDAGTSHLDVRMTDAPGNYDAVLVDVQGVEVTGTGSGTVMLNVTPGVYNLLEFANGTDTLIATGDLEAGAISQIRLILGPNNQIMVDSVLYPLQTPSAMQSGLKIQVHKTLEAGVSYSILLDFDANQSIVVEGTGDYKLKPVIRTIDAAISGSIRGSITPLGIIADVTATSGGISYSTVTNANGEFLIAGLPEGTYDITITPPLPLVAVTISNVSVTVGASTNVGIVVL